MQEKKNKRLAATLLVFTAMAVFLFWFSASEKPVVEKDLFRLADYRNVSRVVLEGPHQKVELEFSGARWMVNDRHPADRDLVRVLFATLQQAEPRREITGSGRDSVKAMLDREGVLVALYDGDREVQRFYAAGNRKKTQGYFGLADRSDIYAMAIPGYRVYVSGIFELTPNQWREKYAFGFNWTNFKSLEATFPRDPAGNFVVSQDQRNVFSIDGMPTDTARLNTFLDNVSLLTVNEFLEPGKITDSLKDAVPEMTIAITDVADNVYRLAIFGENGSQVPVLLDGEQAAFVNRLKLGPLVHPKSYFRLP